MKLGMGVVRGGSNRRVRCATDVFSGKDGFTTAGAAVAILLSCSLAFFCLWSARAQARSAGVQSACDAAALAAQNEVAEFVLAVRVADATLLTMSLTGLAVLGVGTVCCCVPAAASAGMKLIDAGRSILAQRDDVARVEQRALNAAQDGLVLLAQSQAQVVLRENGSVLGGFGVGYVELVPEDAPEIEVGFSEAAEGAAREAADASSKIVEAGQAAEDAARDAADALSEAWRHDCGSYPSPCMAERADALSDISDFENPIALTVDAWSFSDALSRAKAYYERRLAEERPASDSVDELVRSAMRSKFYEYAAEELSEGRAVDDGASAPDIYFPELFSNTDEMRATRLYSERAYPVAEGVIHAYGECPGIEGSASGWGSLEELEAGMYDSCPTCQFDAETLGRVASASTFIENGFEYHYRAVARAAREYCEAQARALPLAQEVKDLAGERFESIVAAIDDVGSHRVEAYPPGRFGTLAAYAFESSPEASASSFFEGPVDIGSFGAVSSAIMVEDSADNAISSLLDGVSEEMGPSLPDAGGAVLGIWGSILEAYGSGVDGLADGVSEVLDGLPLASASGLGTWAADALEAAIASAGLEPVETAPSKPVVANSMHVASRGDGPVAQAVIALKEGASLPRIMRLSGLPERDRRRGSSRRRRAAARRGGEPFSRGRIRPRNVRPAIRLAGRRAFALRGFEEAGGCGLKGQMTVEAALVLPVMVALAFIFANALVFVGDCAAFDIVARDAIRMQADDGYEGAQGAAEVRIRIEERLRMEHEEVEVACERMPSGHVRYTASVSLRLPFLRGASVFGIEVPSLTHETIMTVSPYRKGVVL